MHPPQTYKALTFDCYGTLIDWESGIAAAFAGASRSAVYGQGPQRELLLAEFAAQETSIQQAHPAWPYPKVLEEMYRRLCPYFGLECDAAAERAFAAAVGSWPPFPDSGPALRDLKRRAKLVVVSNIDRASFARSEALLGVRFDGVVTAEEVGAYKPDRRMIEAGIAKARELGAQKHEVLHVAESLYHDIAPAKALGLATCWVDRRAGRGGGASAAKQVDVAPDMRVTTLAELAQAFRA